MPLPEIPHFPFASSDPQNDNALEFDAAIVRAKVLESEQMKILDAVSELTATVISRGLLPKDSFKRELVTARITLARAPTLPLFERHRELEQVSEALKTVGCAIDCTSGSGGFD